MDKIEDGDQDGSRGTLAWHFGCIVGVLSMGDGVEHWRSAGQLLRRIWEALRRGDRGDQAFITALAAHAETMIAMRGELEKL